jgi:ComF family protein
VAGKLWTNLLSLVVPPLCAACRDPVLSGAALCRECRSRLVALPDPRCQRCGAPTPTAAAACRECRRRTLGFDRAWSAFAYEGVARRSVAALKLRGAVAVGRLMADELASRAPSDFLDGALVAVPAHRHRRRRHGFNQARVVTVALGRRIGSPVLDLLERIGPGRPQVGLERKARLLNARGSVHVPADSVAPRRVVLVDDVYTTGATLDACATALRAAGAAEVVALTFARAVLIGT